MSDQIVRKVTPLSSEERGHIESHVQLGAELVSELEPSASVRNIILHHHENHDKIHNKQSFFQSFLASAQKRLDFGSD